MTKNPETSDKKPSAARADDEGAFKAFLAASFISLVVLTIIAFAAR